MANASVEFKAAVPLYLLGGLVLAGVGFLCWHRFSLDGTDETWLDPQQPPTNVDSLIRGVAQSLPTPPRRVKSYPGSLMEWPHSLVGDS